MGVNLWVSKSNSLVKLGKKFNIFLLLKLMIFYKNDRI